MGQGCVQENTELTLCRRRLPKIGVEARLYMPMAAGIAMPIGCFIYAFTSTPSVHWIVPCIGQVILFGESPFYHQ